MARGALLFLLLLLATMTSGCLSARANLLKASARVAFETDAEAPGHQKRIVPWSNRELKASHRYELPYSEDHQGELSLGLAGANRRLNARDAVTAELARQLDLLPASEPPPGEQQERNVGQFARNRPPLQEFINGELLAVEENLLHTAEGRVLVEAVLPLKDIAGAILEHGGGFLPDGAIASDFGPRQRAAVAAERQAIRDLLGKVLAHPVNRDVTIGEWIERDPANRAMLDQELRNVRVLRSERETEPVRRGGEEREFWVYEVEFQARPLVLLARERIERSERARSDMRRAR